MQYGLWGFGEVYGHFPFIYGFASNGMNVMKYTLSCFYHTSIIWNDIRILSHKYNME